MRPTFAAVLAMSLAAAGCRELKDVYHAQQAVQHRFGRTYVNLKNDTLLLTLREPGLVSLEPAAQHDTALAVAGVALAELSGDPIHHVTVNFRPRRSADGGPATRFSWTIDELRGASAGMHP